MRSGLTLELGWAMKKLSQFEAMLNILYDGRIIHHQITEEEAAAILLELAEQANKGEIDESKVDFEYI